MGIDMLINRLPVKSKRTKVLILVGIYAIFGFFALSLIIYIIFSFTQTTISTKACILIGFAGAIFIALGILDSKLTKERLDDSCDERFEIHKLKATDMGVKFSGFLMGIWLCYEYVVNQTLVWQIFVIMATISLVRAIALRYYQKHH